MKRNELYKLNYKDFKDKTFDKAIISVGSCESHGSHLPEGTDFLVAYSLAREVANHYDDILVLPPITIGYSRHYADLPFTISLGYDTTIDVLYDVIESVIKNGIDKIIIINGHDGNIAPVEVASRKIKEVYRDAKIVALTEWWVIAGDLVPEGTFEVWNGQGHGGEGESSIMYHLYPDLCSPEDGKCVIPNNLPPHVDTKWNFGEITNTGQTGDATKASAEKGKIMNEVLVEAMIEAIDYLNERDWDYTTTYE